MTFDVSAFNVQKFDRILKKGLSQGLGKRGGRVCVEAAICQVLGLPHGDDPGCVADSVRSYKIYLNDASWSSPAARARGLRGLGLAQLGSKGVVNDQEFILRMAEKTIRVIIPLLFQEVFPKNQKCLDAARRCQEKGTKEAAQAAASAAYAAWMAGETSAAWAAWMAAASAARAASAAWAAKEAAKAAKEAGNKYLILSAKLALETLEELNSPGVKLLS